MCTNPLRNIKTKFVFRGGAVNELDRRKRREKITHGHVTFYTCVGEIKRKQNGEK